MAARSKKRGSRKRSKTKQNSQNFLKDEIIIWLTLAVSILMLVSIFGFGGFIGETFSDILFLLFGLAAYVIPFLLFGGVTFLISNQGNGQAYVKIGSGVILLVLVCTFLQLIDNQGGLLGSILVHTLTPAIGVVGTYVVDIILMIICVVIITGKSLLQGVKAQSDKAYDKAKQDAARRREQTKALRAEKARKDEKSADRTGRGVKRSDHHVEGVSFDTTLAKKSPEIKELKADDSVKEPDFPIHRGSDVPASVDMQDAEEQQTDAEPLNGPAEPERMPEKENVRGRKKMMDAGAIASETGAVAAAASAQMKRPAKAYRYPPLSLLKRGSKGGGESDAVLRETAMKLQQTLQNFGVQVTVTNVSCGPSVTRYELQPEMGVKVSKIVGLADDIKLNLAAADIRIEAPIPGKAAVGIEVPNKENAPVMLRDLLESPEFKNSVSKVSFAVGKDIGGKVVVADIAKMPHLLIAGATGSGKSVCINTLIMSILYKASPEEVKLIMIDPKVVELSVYNGIPHLMIPVVTDLKKAAGALNWAVAEMTRRYQAFAEMHVRDMKGYNEKIRTMPPKDGEEPTLMPQIVIIVDELADLMMVAPGDVEEAICRLAQLARAAGIHLVLATQRPSVNVITGLIKANMPSRIAFSVSSGVDSRTIIDMNGAEKLLGKGDMLFYPSGYQKPARVQGSFVTDKEVQSVVEYLKDHNSDVTYDEEIVNHVNTAPIGNGAGAGASQEDDRDVHFVDAGRLIIDKDKASIGMLQRSFKIGFNRAARIMDQLAEAGVVGPEEGTKPRKVLMTSAEFEQYIEESL
nr:DNA translocase FtsK [uncultured Merdimonas sp.]